MKGLLKFITCGSVDDGKSTLIGHILYASKLLYADQERALELDSRVGSRGGRIDYSLLLDGLMAEREQGITIDVAYRYFTTDNRSFIAADTPGHEEYTRNMAVGAAFAELAIILIDASQGVLAQTRRHARICSLMGIKHFVFAVNKMDIAEYSRVRFCEIEQQINSLSRELSLHDTAIIPLSATEGDNVIKKSENTPWYSGKPLLEYLETIEIDSTDEKGFYMPVQRVCRPDRTFRGFEGQIESGTISVGDEITVIPGYEKAGVKGILAAGREVRTAFAGQPVTLSLDKEIDVSRGKIITKGDDFAAYAGLTVSLLWMDSEPLLPGKDYLIKLGTRTISGVASKINYAVDVNTGEHKPTERLFKNEIAVCEIKLDEAVAADLFSKHKTLGELILIDRVTNSTAACGTVTALSDKNGSGSDEKASFEYGGIKARGDIFEEFLYDTHSFNVLKYRPVTKNYTIGDTIPVSGDSYSYPDSFDIIVLRDMTAIKIRSKIITEIVPAVDYEFSGFPVINGRGFEIRANSAEEINQFLQDYENGDNRDFYQKWLCFGTYRKIAFGE